MLKGKKIVLGVTGGIAAYKAVDLTSRLKKAGADVCVVMTEHAQEFVRPLTFKEISGHKVATSMWAGNAEFSVEHIALAKWADLYLVAPATANIIAKMAHGIADDLLSTTLLAMKGPVILCPAMNTDMLENQATVANLTALRHRGVTVMPPAEGMLACDTVGGGRLPEPRDIVSFVDCFLGENGGDLAGLKIMVTAGETQEPVDPVRFIGNRSSGKMGYAIAKAAASRGADVLLIAGSVNLHDPFGVKIIKTVTTEEMLDACLKNYDKMDVVIKAAAVADYRPAKATPQKIKKGDEALSLSLVKTPDILAELGAKKKDQILIGFAAETENLIENAKKKIGKKNLDMIVANDITAEGAGFNADTNVVRFIFPDGKVLPLEKMDKADVAERLLDIMIADLRAYRKK
ncbi:MAG: bifunctional phosphopantothenoylcysteine decarboxylase/phosphopantothenate--cysteine ligase CoaBC [Phascolarctobacterium sp.]|nr:bifunctional phosphopantothenoylcysteine decarboxylase/phosphopantothenate--cysteine ligase CoaBC [Phascolarctobacterium sp.]